MASTDVSRETNKIVVTSDILACNLIKIWAIDICSTQCTEKQEINENFPVDLGMDDSNSPFISLENALKDAKRIKYHNDYLTNLAASIRY